MLFSNRDLVRLIVPLVIEQFLAVFIGMADTVMVSGISEGAVSAVSLVDSINVLFIQLFSAMATGGAIVAAQYLGKQSRREACGAAKQLLYVALAIAMALGAVSLFFAQPIITLCFGQLQPATMAYACAYLRISAVSYPALALYNGGAALLRAMSNSRASMFTALMMNLINVAGNALLIYGLKMEVAGAAIASLVSRCVGAIIVMRLLLNQELPIYLDQPLRPQMDRQMIGRIFRLGIPSGIENSIFQIGKLLVAGVLSTLGEAQIAANAVSNSIASLWNLPGSAMGLALVTVVGQCVGAGDRRQARYYTRKLMGAVYLCAVVMYLVLFLLAPQIAGLFNLSREGLDAACQVLKWYCVAAAIFWPASFTLPNALRAAGDARFTMTISVISMWSLRIGLSYVLVRGLNMGLLGVWAAMFADWVLRSGCFLWRYRGDKWLQKSVV
ncbi:MAG: MATE family efflux transporter [Clostridiales bacterium]|nr:MATE family efflux transporter [Clostridiales bacterium]